jgi:hypothetical protein
MDLITLTLNKNHLISGISILGIGIVTYFVNRYSNTIKKTTNQSYYKPSELIKGIPNLNYMKNQQDQPIIYIFWNGDINSTYLLIDLLVQDKIIQPLYVERYTIIKDLEKDILENIINNNKNNKNNKDYSKDYSSNTYLKNIVLLKKCQDYELKQLEIVRLMILGKYPEFSNNLFPTTYITSIHKDLEMTSQFYNVLQEIKPIYYDGIDFIEQILRYIKYSGYIKNNNDNNDNNNNNNNNNATARIILGCNKEYKNYDLLVKLINKNIVTTIDLPLKTKNKEEMHYLCTSFLSNNIMKYFNNKKFYDN